MTGATDKTFLDERIHVSGSYLRVVFDGCVLVKWKGDGRCAFFRHVDFIDCLFIGDGWPAKVEALVPTTRFSPKHETEVLRKRKKA